MTDLERLAELTLAELDIWSQDERDTKELVLALFGRYNEAGYLLVHDPDNTNPPSKVWLDNLLVDLR